MIIPRCTANNT